MQLTCAGRHLSPSKPLNRDSHPPRQRVYTAGCQHSSMMRRMRISLGLKPLAMDSTKEKEDQAARAAHDKKRAEQKQAEADLLAQRVKE